MKLATLNDGSRDGTLIVVSRDLSLYAAAIEIAPTLQAALDGWDAAAPRLEALSAALNAGDIDSAPFDQAAAHSPLPRASLRGSPDGPFADAPPHAPPAPVWSSVGMSSAPAEAWSVTCDPKERL